MRRWLVLTSWCWILGWPGGSDAQEKVPPPPPLGDGAARHSAPLAQNCGSLRVDEQRLRNLVDLPGISFQFRCAVLGGVSLPKLDNLADIPKRIETLKRQMRGDLNDAEAYAELSGLYGKLKDKHSSRRAELKALELLQKHVQAEPQSGRLHALLAECLAVLERYPEALKEAEHAVSLAPTDGHCWCSLGLLRMTEMEGILYGSLEKLPVELRNNWDKLCDILRKKVPSAEQKARAQACLLDADRCFERAVSAAPAEHECYRCRCLWGIRRHQWYQYAQPAKADLKKMLLDETHIQALKKLSELCPEDPEPIAVYAFFNVMLAALQAPPGVEDDVLFGLARVPLSTKQKQICDAARKSLIRLANSPNKYVAESAARNFASLLVMLGDLATARQYAQRAVDLGTTWEDPWNILFVSALFDDTVCLGLQRAFSFVDPQALGLWSVARLPQSKCVAILKKRLARFPSADNHFKLAAALNKLAAPADAERELRQAVSKYPQDLRCQLGMACLLIKRDALYEAEGYVSRAAALRKQCNDRSLWSDCVFTQAIYIALRGQPEVGQSWLRRLSEDCPKNERIKEALAAFERSYPEIPLLPPASSSLLGSYRNLP